MINEIHTKQLLNLLDDNETKIIDIRPVDAYNGWKLGNETRGGHNNASMVCLYGNHTLDRYLIERYFNDKLARLNTCYWIYRCQSIWLLPKPDTNIESIGK